MIRLAGIIGLCLLSGLPVFLLDGTPGAVFALLASTLLAFGGAVSCAIAARRGSGHARAGWALLALACLSWGTGNAYWSHNELIRHAEVLFPSLGDIGFIIFPLAGGAGLWLITGRTALGSRFTSLLDGLTVVTALFIGSWGVTLRAVWGAGGDTVISFLVSLAYPIGDLVLATMAVLLAARTRRGNRTVVGLLIGALFAMTLSDVLFAVATADGSYFSGTASDAGWVIAFAAFAMAGWTSARRGPAAPAPSDAVRLTGPGRWQLLLPYLPFGIAAVICVVQVLVSHPMDGPQSVALLFGVGLVLARQLVTLIRNSTLTEQLRHQAYHDSLTGLANRELFAARLGHLLAAGSRPILLYLDLDDFKLVNDNLGHDAGDDLLRGVADRLRATFPAAVVIARLGGDEFAVLARHGSHPDREAERLLDGLRQPFLVGPHTVAVTGSVGAASAEPGATAEDLRKHVDLAMYAAKGRGKNAHAVFEPTMRETFEAEMALREELRTALRDNALRVAYQPIVDLRDGRMTGLEALARWTHPVRGEISPTTFIPVAERAAMIAEIGQFVLTRACAEFAGWDGARAGGYLSVNVSPLQLLDPAFADRVVDTVSRHGLHPGQLVLEITEEALADESYVIPALRRLRATGVRIAIDDFGTGYSSLRYLHRFPADIVKIDRSYIADIGTDPAGRRLVETLWQLFSTLGLLVVAEGVEEPEQARRLAEMGCTLAQGYLFGRPANIEDLPVAQLAGPVLL